jgi:hypothetical protein
MEQSAASTHVHIHPPSLYVFYLVYYTHIHTISTMTHRQSNTNPYPTNPLPPYPDPTAHYDSATDTDEDEDTSDDEPSLEDARAHHHNVDHYVLNDISPPR